MGLGRHLHDEAGSLALGQQRILEIARALASDPCILLLDEPAAGLRYQEKRELAELLRKLRAEGMAILLVEHDMDFVMGLVDRVVVMDFGEKIAEACPPKSSTIRRCLKPIWAEWNKWRRNCWKCKACAWPTTRSRPSRAWTWRSARARS